ncbi:hypothetical protein [Cupriavidus pinatubonensis]|uniref:Uncharacterized protein n=1 Tax=Cupriavidus pinatubonensis TaxID=248026 RepID=A0ABM8Y3L8_9BURK|nr:hypothetical protein [Cupriavidus pinatubonensis]CAG9187362.1 hypothetical protein LMG23994_06807 [Cupriavidus pinatubonensis]
MNKTRRLTVRSRNGALHIVPIWQALTQYTEQVCRVAVRVGDAGRGGECLMIDIADIEDSQLQDIATKLSQSPWLLTTTVEQPPARTHSHVIAHR